jgi:hypothetical protein
VNTIDISKVRTTRGGDDVRGLRYESDSANDKYPISGLRYHDGQWVMDAWTTDGLYMRDGLARDADLIESPADRSQSCPHSTTSPDGVCDACRGVAAPGGASRAYAGDDAALLAVLHRSIGCRALAGGEALDIAMRARDAILAAYTLTPRKGNA